MTPTTFFAKFRPAMAHIAPVTAAAPPISHFISSMPLAGFIEMPPVSKVTPFPTRAKGASSPPPFQFITTMKESRRLPCPTPKRAPIPSFSIAASSRISTSSPSALSAEQRDANSAGNNLLAGSNTRSRAKNTPLASACRSLIKALSAFNASPPTAS